VGGAEKIKDNKKNQKRTKVFVRRNLKCYLSQNCILMYRRPKTSAFADLFHKGFVVSCIGVTIYGLYIMGLRAERYFTVIRPQQKLKELELKQQLLTEGRESLEELRT